MVRKLVWLKTLKASPRSCRRVVSPKRIFFVMVKSTRFVDGPWTTPRPAVPGTLATGVPAAGLDWKQALVNHSCKVCGALAFGSQRRFGRLPAMAAGLLPRPAASKLEVVIV